MKTLLTLVLTLCAITGIAQLQSFIVRGDTLFSKNPSTGVEVQLNKLGISTTTQTALDSKAPIASPSFSGIVTGVTASMVGLGNVNNTSDASKPVSTATQAALDNKAGYGTGFGGTVTQVTNKATAVTLNKLCGQITMNAAALAAAAEVVFTVNNSLVAATDVPVVAIQSVGTAGSYLATVSSVSAGSFTITISNASAASLSQALVLNVIIIKGSNN